MAGDKVLVVGSTGRTGAHVVKKLLAENYSVRAFARSASKAASMFGSLPKFEVAEGSSTQSPAQLASTFNGVRHVVCTQGGGGWDFFGNNSAYDVEYVGLRNLVDAAKAAKVEKFVLVSTVAITRPTSFIYLMLNTMFGRVMHWKGEGETYLRQSGLPYVIVRPGGLTQEPAKGLPALLLDQGDKCSGRVSREDVAAACVEALRGCPPGITFEVVERKPEDGPNLAKAWRDAFAALRRD